MSDTPEPEWTAFAMGGTPEATRASVVLHPGEAGAGTIVAFAGMRHGFVGGLDDVATMSALTGRREFSSLLSPFGVNVLLVTDGHDAWYQSGLVSVAATPEQAAAALTGLIPEGSSLLGTLGASSGGMAAIIFGALMGAPRVLAFSPRTVVTAGAVAARAGRRGAGWAQTIDLDRDTADLRRFLRTAPRTDIEIHLGGDNAHDVAQAGRIDHLDGVRVVRHPTDAHMCARWLKEQHLLGAIVESRFRLTRRSGVVAP